MSHLHSLPVTVIDAKFARCSGRRSLDSLTADDLAAPPRPWPAFLRGGSGGAWAAAYDVPPDLDALQERLQANVLYYLVRGVLQMTASVSSRC